MPSKTSVSVIAVVAAVTAGLFFIPASASAQSNERARECDRYVGSYARSSARKLWRALDRRDYALEPLELDGSIEIPGEALDRDESVEFELLEIDSGPIAGVVDRTRQWEQTFVIARSRAGPIVVSQTWQPRHLRVGQTCEPFTSAVEWPPLTASTVDIEPFEYWGLRAAWRIRDPDNTEEANADVEEILTDVMRRHLGLDDYDG